VYFRNFGQLRIKDWRFTEQLSSFPVRRLVLLWTSDKTLSVYLCFPSFTDLALAVSSELESVLRLKTVDYFITRRPWLGMFHAVTMVTLVPKMFVLYNRVA